MSLSQSLESVGIYSLIEAFMKNNPYSTEMNTNIHLITFSILLFTNFQTNKQRSSGLYQHYIFFLTNIDFIALNISVNNLVLLN
jgi:ABC-type antimicrobial peptide transport system permease subunit